MINSIYNENYQRLRIHQTQYYPHLTKHVNSGYREDANILMRNVFSNIKSSNTNQNANMIRIVIIIKKENVYSGTVTNITNQNNNHNHRQHPKLTPKLMHNHKHFHNHRVHNQQYKQISKHQTHRQSHQ